MTYSFPSRIALILFSIGCGSVTVSVAQSPTVFTVDEAEAGVDSFGYREGTIMTPNDTIEGLVKYANAVPSRILDDIKFKKTKDGKVQTCPPETLLGFTSGPQIFHSVQKEDGSRVFMELIVDGNWARLYYLRTQMRVGTGGPGGMSGGSPGGHLPYLKKKGQQFVFYAEKGKFTKTISEYFSEDVALSEKIKNGEYRKKELRKIVAEYNRSMDKKN
jgi:hypothetical protein